ncbi:MAG: PH domain-containing protein [Gammaproteobacteria bacterium]|nr:PH domain-containing protein [Gammaproteobacteria bacterium]
MTTTSPEFSNKQLDSAQLLDIPQFSQQQFQPLEPVYWRVNLLLRVLISLVIIAALVIVKYQTFSPLESFPAANIHWLILAISLLLISRIGFGYLSDCAKGYAIRELDISYQSGVIFKKIVTQPFLRLQHIELKRGPFERKVNLATLQVFSAGGAVHTFELPGLSLEQAQQLRQFMLDHKDVTQHG